MSDATATATLFDFGRARDAAAAWFVVDDGVMGGISQGTVQAAPEGLLFSGVVRPENNGGFSSIQVRLHPADFSLYSGIALRVRGDGRRYGFYLRDDFSPLMHQGDFTTQAGTWQTVRLPFDSLRTLRYGMPVRARPLDRRHVVSMSFIIGDQQFGSFALEIALVQLYQEIRLV
ncbi:MAG: CIA30 family protein [Anaerolineae bacterium]|nr:CIA30 family protein [Anaerolineae bacterium]